MDELGGLVSCMTVLDHRLLQTRPAHREPFTLQRPAQRARKSSRPFPLDDDTLAQVILFLSMGEKRAKFGSWEWGWDWITVRAVSRQWRAVANGTPRIWAYIYRCANLKRTELFLRSSKESNLIVDLDVAHKDADSVHDRNITDNLKAILAELPRISHLRIPMAKEWKEELAPLLKQSAPRLKSIHIQRNDSPDGTIFVPFPKPSSLLESVVLSAIELSPSVACLNGLTSLDISYIPGRTPRLSDILFALNGCPNITSFTIVADSFADSSQFEHNFKSLKLPLLRYLSITMSDFSSIYLLLGSLQARSLPRLDIHCTGELSARDIFKAECLSSWLTNFYDNKRVEIHYIEKILRIEVNDVDVLEASELGLNDLRNACITMTFEENIDQESVYVLARKILKWQLEAAEYVKVDVHRKRTSEETWYNMFCDMPSARNMAISFDSDMDNKCGVLRALQCRSSPSTSLVGSNIGLMPCPELENLLLICPDIGEQEEFYLYLEASLKQRSQSGYRVQKLSLTRCNRSEMDLQGLLVWVGGLQYSRGYAKI